MSSSVFTDIQNAFTIALSELDGVTIAWENTKDKPVANSVYLRPHLKSAKSILRDVDGNQENPGFLQIDVCIPLNKGTKDLTDWIDTLYDTFQGVTLTEGNTTVYIRAVSRGPSSREEAWYVGIVEIYFTCYS